MKQKVSFILALLAILSMLAGCNRGQISDETQKPVNAETDPIRTEETKKAESAEDDTETEKNDNETTAPVEIDFAQAAKDMFTDRDYEIGYSENECIRIELRGTTAAASDNSVKIDGSTITITKDASYIISGKLDDGMIIVDAPEKAKMQIVLNGVDITSQTSAPLYILEADKVFLTTAPGSDNTLTSGERFVAIDENNIDAAIFSKQDLTLNGSGTLTVNAPAGHGIVSKDDLVITSGTYTVNAASHGLDANDSVRIDNAEITITAGKDGIHSENNDDAAKGFVYIASGTVKITAEGDGISSGAYLQIEGGKFDILAGGGYENGTKQSSAGWGGFPGNMHGGGMGGFGGGRPGQSSSSSASEENSTSMKGLKSGSDMLLSNGTFLIDSADDALHSNTNLSISGGTFTIASGDDALHAEENLKVTDGNIGISTSYEGLEALHIHVSGGNITLTATDDGFNAAGGNDESGTTGGRDGMFGYPGGGRPGGPGGWGSSNSNGSILISGGTIYINSSGDGMDANGTLEITGAHTTVVGPIQGDTATLDYDVSGSITGGTFIGTGSTMMAQTFSDSSQGVIAVNAGSQAAGTQITLTDKDGTVLLTRTPELPFAVVILSSPDLVVGESYTLNIGDLSGEMTAN